MHTKQTSLNLILLGFLFCKSLLVQAEEYRYKPGTKPDPFSPLTLTKPEFKGTTRMQAYEVSAYELVGVLLASDVTALVMTPEPKEGNVVRVGDRMGKKGGRIISIAKTKLVVREPVSGNLLEQKEKFSDVTLELVQNSQSNRPAAKTGLRRATSGSQSNLEGGSSSFPPPFQSTQNPGSPPLSGQGDRNSPQFGSPGSSQPSLLNGGSLPIPGGTSPAFGAPQGGPSPGGIPTPTR